eukprot:c28282_g1_i1 orf=40-210(-)
MCAVCVSHGFVKKPVIWNILEKFLMWCSLPQLPSSSHFPTQAMLLDRSSIQGQVQF